MSLASEAPRNELYLASTYDGHGRDAYGTCASSIAAHPARAESAVPLRLYQAKAVEEFHASVDRGDTCIALVSPTGSGKTNIVGKLVLDAIARDKRVLFLAHRRELIHQAHARFVAMGVDPRDVGVVMGNDPRKNPDARVQIASVDTLRRRAMPEADLVVRDECHRALAATDRKIRERYPNAVHLGVTATLIGPGGRSLGNVYKRQIVVATAGELAAEGYLDTPLVYTVAPSQAPDLRAVRTKQGDYDQQELEGAVNTAALVGNVVEHWKKLASDRRTLVFATSVRHSEHIIERFRAEGVAAEHVDANTPNDVRAAVLTRLESGETQVVSQVALFTEGTDLPWVKCLVLARPTKSLGLYLQMCGRGLRPWNGVQCILLDHAGCVNAHGLPLEDRHYSLEPGAAAVIADPKKPSPATCPSCFAVFKRGPKACPSCGAELRPPAEELPPMRQEAAGELTLAQPGVLSELEGTYEHLVRIALLRGYKPGWAYYKFVTRYRVQPSWRATNRLKNMPLAAVAAEHLRCLIDEHGDVTAAEEHYFSEIRRHSYEQLSLSDPSIGFLPKGGVADAL